MQLRYPADKIHNPLLILRKAGYKHFVDPVTKKESFVLQLTNGFYPRFHLYVMDEGGEIIFDLHLDQKKPSYQGSRAHGGEYDGQKVEEEMNRIAGWASHVAGVPLEERPIEAEATEIIDENDIEPEKPTSADPFLGIFG